MTISRDHFLAKPSHLLRNICIFYTLLNKFNHSHWWNCFLLCFNSESGATFESGKTDSTREAFLPNPSESVTLPFCEIGKTGSTSEVLLPNARKSVETEDSVNGSNSLDMFCLWLFFNHCLLWNCELGKTDSTCEVLLPKARDSVETGESAETGKPGEGNGSNSLGMFCLWLFFNHCLLWNCEGGKTDSTNELLLPNARESVATGETGEDCLDIFCLWRCFNHCLLRNCFLLEVHSSSLLLSTKQKLIWI